MAGSSSDGEPLVAREVELDRVGSALDAVKAGRGRMVLLAGEPGVGKTRLAREVTARATGMRSFTGRCFEQHVAVPFFPFTELLEPALAAAPAALHATARQQWPALSFVIPGFDADRPQELDGRDAQLHVFRATTAFLHALADVHPLILLLDDLHWADSSSLSLLLFLGRHLEDARILILGTYRDVEVGGQHPLEATLRELIRQRFADEINVGRLTADGTAALVRARLGVADVSGDLVALVHARAQGNPFFTEELLKEFVENGVLTAHQGHAHPVAANDFYVPHSIRSVIGERLGRLPPAVQEVLRLASLLGPEFDLDTLLASSSKSEMEMLDALDTALEARIIEEVRSSRERFAFAHALIQQTLYEELPIHRRRRMHLRIGEALLAAPTGSPALSTDLARHFLLGGDAARATSFAIDAGDHASARYAHAEAVHHYQVALDLLTDDVRSAGRAADVQIRLADELYDLNQLNESLAAYEAAGTRFEQLGDALGQARAEWGIARLHQGRYAMASAEVHVDAALRLWPDQREDKELVQLLVDAARIKTYLGAGQTAIPLAERAVALAERLGDAKLRALALFGLSVVPVSVLPRPADNISILDRAIPLAAQAGDWRLLSRLYINRGTNEWLLGHLERNIADRRRAIEAAERSGEVERQLFVHATLAGGLLRAGAWEEGRAEARAGLRLAFQDELDNTTAICQAELAWMEGRHDDAIRHFQSGLAMSRLNRDLQGVTYNLTWLVWFALELGRPADAEAHARQAMGVARSEWGPVFGFVAGTFAETLARVASSDAAAALAEAEELVDEFGLAVAKPQLLRARAILLAEQGATDAALDALRTSADIARSQHEVIQLAQTLALHVSIGQHQTKDTSALAQADAERQAIVARIGPEVRGLAWAQGLPQPLGVQSQQIGSPLSPREREVAALIANGLSNRQIAQTLVISERTVENHVGSILAKLGLERRAQVAACAAQHGLEVARQ